MLRSIQKNGAVTIRCEIADYYNDLDMVRREIDRVQSDRKERLDWIRQSLLDTQFTLVDDFERFGGPCPYSDEELRATSFIQFLHYHRGLSW